MALLGRAKNNHKEIDLLQCLFDRFHVPKVERLESAKIQAGSFNKHFFLRWGGSQGYWSGGIGLSGKSASLDLSTYGEELHSTKFREIEDRRIVIRYGGRF